MDPDKSSNSSFEDLSNLNDNRNAVEKNETVVTSSGLENEKDNNDKNATKPLTKDNLNSDSNDNNNDDFMDLIGSGQITKKIITPSQSDEKPHSRDFVKITYKATLDNGIVVEDFNNYEVQVGDFEVVQGLDMTIPFMKVGEKAEVHLSSRFAYGSIGLKNDSEPEKSIPPNTDINYVIELLECRPEDEDKILSFETRKLLGNRKRERANFWFNRNEYNTAIQLYRRALEYLDESVGEFSTADENMFSNKDLQELLEDRLVVYNNLAMAQIKITAYDAALISLETVLRYQPNNSKALFRKGRILDVKGDTKGAIALLQKAATLEPDSKSIQQDLSKLIIRNRREERNEKEMYQKMLGQARKLEQAKQIPVQQQQSDVSTMRLLGYIMGSILIGVAGVAMYRYKY